MGTRSDFESQFFSPENSLFRRAVLMHALAVGPAWGAWKNLGSNQLQPSFYNEIAFLMCYQIYRNDPKVGRTIQMRDFLLVRSAGDAGYLADPAHKNSDSRTHAKANIRDTIVGFQQGANKGNSDQICANVYLSVYSEMWLQNGAMRAFLATPGLDNAMGRLGQNTNFVRNDQEKSFWLQSLIGRFSGRAVTSQRFGQTFDTDKLGLTRAAPRLMMGQRQVPPRIGGHRG